MKFENFNSPEKEILLEYFKKLPMMDKWIADIIQAYIYRIIEDEGVYGRYKTRRKYMTRFGERHGEYIEWYIKEDLPPGQVNKNVVYCKANYKDDKKEGEYNEFHMNGVLDERSYYKEGVLEGELRKWYITNSLMFSCNYKNGNLDGRYYHYFNNGRPLITCTYKEGVLDGEYKEWYIDGVLKVMYEYKDGKKVGNCKDWYEGSKWM